MEFDYFSAYETINAHAVTQSGLLEGNDRMVKGFEHVLFIIAASGLGWGTIYIGIPGNGTPA